VSTGADHARASDTPHDFGLVNVIDACATILLFEVGFDTKM
jgi:hypothetical protein